MLGLNGLMPGPELRVRRVERITPKLGCVSLCHSLSPS